MTARRSVIIPEGLPLPYPGFSPVLRYDDWVFLSAQTAADFASGLASEVTGNPDMPLIGEDIRFREARCVLTRLKGGLDAAGVGFEHCLRIDQFPATRSIMDAYHTVRTETVAPPRPASTSVLVDSLLAPAARIGVELVAIRPQHGVFKEAVVVGDVPQSLFGIVPAIRAGDFVFVAAQVATDFTTGLAPEARRNPAFWQGSEIELETRYMLRNFETVLKAAGSSLVNVVKAFVYLTDINDIPRLDRVWREAFPVDPPARTIIPASGLGVAGTRVEINLVAVTDAGATRKEIVQPLDGAPALFHESRAVKAGDLLFLSGLLAADSNGLVPAARVNPHHPYVTATTEVQTEAILEQADMLCRSADCRLSDAARMLTVHTDLRDWASSKTAWQRRFTAGDPATTSIAVPGPLAVPGATVLLDLWIGA